MSIQHPDFLADDFRILEWYGAHLRKKKGLGFRRSIRFDDDRKSLYVDVKLPHSDKWHRILPVAAHEARADLDRAEQRETRRAWDASMPATGANAIGVDNMFAGITMPVLKNQRLPSQLSQLSQPTISPDGIIYVSPQKR